MTKKAAETVAYLRGHRQSQAPLGPLAGNPGVHVHHVQIMVLSCRDGSRQPKPSTQTCRMNWCCHGDEHNWPPLSRDCRSPERKQNCGLCHRNSRKGLRECVCVFIHTEWSAKGNCLPKQSQRQEKGSASGNLPSDSLQRW